MNTSTQKNINRILRTLGADVDETAEMPQVDLDAPQESITNIQPCAIPYNVPPELLGYSTPQHQMITHLSKRGNHYVFERTTFHKRG